MKNEMRIKWKTLFQVKYAQNMLNSVVKVPQKDSVFSIFCLFEMKIRIIFYIHRGLCHTLTYVMLKIW